MDNGTTPSVTIRQATLHDLPLLRELWLAMIAEQHTTPFYPFPHEDDDARLTADLAQVLQQPSFAAFLAADDQGTPLGFCAVEHQERRFGTPRTYGYFHAIYTLPEARTYHQPPVAVRLCLAACTWARVWTGVQMIECDNTTGAPPWWRGVLPFKATCTHYVAKILDCRDALQRFGIPPAPPEPPPPTLEAFPDQPPGEEADTKVEV
jgi:hypothetical protein